MQQHRVQFNKDGIQMGRQNKRGEVTTKSKNRRRGTEQRTDRMKETVFTRTVGATQPVEVEERL